MPKIIILLAFLPILAAAVKAPAQFSKTAEWTAEVFVDYGFIEPNITYAKAGGVDLKLDVYRPKTKNAPPFPTLVFYHGGGWRGGSKEAYSLRVLPWLEAGWAVVNVEYRLTGAARAPAAIEDCRCALRWVAENAAKYNFDPAKIVVSGQSAGGHLALMTGMATNEKAFDANCPGAETRVAAVVNWFGITDVGDLLEGKNKTEFASNWIGADRFGDADLIRMVSPLSYVRAGLPPIITIHGDADPLVPYSHAVRLHEALTKAGVPNELFTVKKGDHGDFTKADSVAAYKAIRRFLRQNGVWKFGK
ncbi:MAG: alpha/beta hydrolase [Acidobacteria bacterium]|nr:alpha/beta hydrolase [Acidobacteriota bacterium]